MPATKTRVPVNRAKQLRHGARVLGIRHDEIQQLVDHIAHGISINELARFQKKTGLSWAATAHFIGMPLRTLTRRQGEGRLDPNESDRLWRAAVIFDMAVDLFNGDSDAARGWLERPQPGLGHAVPIEFASTSIGALEVEKLITRLEYGVGV
jgi:putative toxin-antitoxin system antitoxin component (TIGR02293 family)